MNTERQPNRCCRRPPITGAIAGAVGGALLGYLTNTSDGEQGRKNALLGAGIGALGGAAVGSYMDRRFTLTGEAVRICVLVRSEARVAPNSASAQYLNCDGKTELTPPDLRLRRAYTATVVLRNRRFSS